MLTKEEQKRVDQVKRDELVAGLRELADLYEKNALLPLPRFGVAVQLDVTIRKPAGIPDEPFKQIIDEAETKRAVKRAVRGMGRGRKDKVYSDYSFVVNKQLSENVLLQVQTTRDAVCRKVPTGRTIVHPAQVYTTPESIEEEFEWVCDDPVFAEPKEEAA